MSLVLNESQESIIYHGMKGEALSVDSAPGSGKSFILRHLASKMNTVRGCYVAFNDSTAQSAKGRFANNFHVSTSHSLALSRVNPLYRDKLGVMNNYEVVDFLDIKPSSFASSLVMAGYINETLAKFCQSAERIIRPHHVPNIRDISDAHTQERKEQIAIAAAKIFDTARDVNSKVPVSHDIYMKIFQLEGRNLGFDVIMLDEAQDTNPVLWDVLRRQGDTQLIVVGDRFQQLNQFRGAINVMDMMPDAVRINMDQSYRFGPDMAMVANTVLCNHLHTNYRIKGRDGLKSLIGNTGELERLHLFRTNLGLLTDVLDYSYNQDRKVHVLGGTGEMRSLLLNCQKLKRGERPRHGELSRFSCWEQFEAYAESPVGRHLYKFKTITERFDVGHLLSALETVDKHSADKSDCIFSTVHKAKGLESPSVRIAGDFKSPADRRFSKSEGNIYYVAATRAKATEDSPAVLNETAVRNYIKTKARYEVSNERKTKVLQKPEEPKKFEAPKIDATFDISGPAPF